MKQAKLPKWAERLHPYCVTISKANWKIVKEVAKLDEAQLKQLRADARKAKAPRQTVGGSPLNYAAGVVASAAAVQLMYLRGQKRKQAQP